MRLASASLLLAALCGLAACSGETDVPQPAASQPGESAETAAPAQAAAPAVPPPPPAFMQCRSCHALEPGKNLIGPSLVGVYGSKAASVAGFGYSKALKASGLTWGGATLDAWLAGPAKLVPGTRMVLPVNDPAKRQEIIAYLKTLK